MNKIKIFLIVALIGMTMQSFSQGTGDLVNGSNLLGQNTITTSVPFLIIAPDSRAGAMGDAGVATTPDANSQHWNPAKYAFIEKDMGVSISYTPWLRNLVDDINLAYITGYKRIDKSQTVSASLLYFSLGNITFTDETGSSLGDYKPNEFAVDGAYSRLLSDNFSASIAMRFIYSNLTSGQYAGNTATKPGTAVAADLSAYYRNKIKIGELAFGMNISNIGSRISYTTEDEKDFIPINLRLGGALTAEIDDYNKIMITADVNKLLVPTTPIYDGDGTEPENILFGKDPNVSVPVGMFQSFADAPGNKDDGSQVFREEMSEFNYAIGMEYWYSNQFAIRAGYFNEHENKGNRKFYTIGLGLKLNVFALDFAYLVPSKGGQSNPLANTLRFTLTFDFEGLNTEG